METTGSRRWLSTGLAALAVALVAVALLGPLAFGVIEYRVGETLRNQAVGLDLVSLAVVAPLAAVASLLLLRRHPAGPPLAAGIGAYAAYTALQYLLGPDYTHLAGDNERLFPLTLFVFAAGWAVAVAGWNGVDADALRPPRILARLALPLLALLAFGRYVPALADWMSSSPRDASYLAGPGFSWTIATLDLGVFLPLTAAACVGVARDRPWAARAFYTVVTWFGLVGTAVAAMAVTMYVRRDPAASGADALTMSLLGGAFVLVAVLAYLPLLPGTPLSRRRRITITAVAGAVAFGASFGGWGLLSDSEKLGVNASWLEGSPFPNYVVPGVVLLVVIGGGMAATAVAAALGSRFCGVAAAVIETATIGYHGPTHVVLLLCWVVVPAVSLIAAHR